jgi:HEAT repeat protein
MDSFEAKFHMTKTLTEIRSLARSHTRTALRVLVGVMSSKDATAAARVSAANAILDRGWGKAPQAIQNGDDGAFELVQRIERVIVHPENGDK